MFVDPVVCRAKFRRELDQFKVQQSAYHQRGVWLLDDTFPEIFLVLMSVRSAPLSAVFGVVINFENYDIEPASVQLVHPVTRQPLRYLDLPHGMPRLRMGPDRQPATDTDGNILFDTLVQAEDPQRPGFICLQGVREYHAHPAHTGDSWWLHRGTGVGRLAYLINILATYGIDTVMGLRFQIQFAGFSVNVQSE